MSSRSPTMAESVSLSPPPSSGANGRKRKRSNEHLTQHQSQHQHPHQHQHQHQPASTAPPRPPHAPHTRTLAACDACRVSKTRCDAARPVCSKCLKRGRECVYPDKDPSSIFEVWGSKILSAIENQGRLLSDIAQSTRENYQQVQLHQQQLQQQQQQQHQQQTPQSHSPALDHDDPDTMSRKDVPWTPITGADKILDWAVFPPDKPVRTLPASVYAAKPNPYALETLNPSLVRMLELRDIFLAKIEPKCPIVDVEELNAYIFNIAEDGFGWSASSCMVLLVFAMAAIWGHYPNDERRLVVTGGANAREPYTLAIPEHRIKDSSIYFAMAQRRMSAASLDDSLHGVLCYCLFGTYFQYVFEPVQAWKMFRTASMLWESYNLKHASGDTERSKEEESLEARLYWTCLKAECEMRYEIFDLPACALQESNFPFSLPSFPMSDGVKHGTEHMLQHDSPSMVSTPASHYYFLAEISLRRLLNRARHAATALSPTIDSFTAAECADTLHQLEDQLQQWLECLPSTLRFNIPPDSWPPPDEPELVKLMRERYVEVRELLYRAFLYICLHGGTRLTHTQAKLYGAKASAGLRLSVYRVHTERPFFRHAGSWIGCRVRFNQALCLTAAARGKELGVESAAYIVVPPTWRECVGMVIDRLETWSDQGAGVGNLAVLLKWLMKQDVL